MKEYVIKKEPYSEYRDNKTRYYSITDSNYFDSKRPLTDAKTYALKKGYDLVRIVYPSFRKKDKIISVTDN